MLWFNIEYHLAVVLFLNFNTSYVVVQPCWSAAKRRASAKFQYILCCGSTVMKMFMIVWFWDFNTSYVVVQQRRCFFWMKEWEISIHLMLWFNEKIIFLDKKDMSFQYILCCGSTLQPKY